MEGKRCISLLSVRTAIIVVLARFLHEGVTRRVEFSEKSTRVYSLTSAETFVNDHIEEAMALARNQSADFEPESGNGGETNYTNLKPLLEVAICVQVDIDLSSQVPGLTINIGILGAVEYNFKNGCWGFKLEVMFGATYGFKVLGYKMKVSFALTGFMHVYERPVAQVAEESDIVAELSRYLPDKVDQRSCATQNPFSIIMVAVRHYIFTWVGSNEVEQQLEAKRLELQNQEERFSADYALFEAIFEGEEPAPIQEFQHYRWTRGLFERLLIDVSDGTNIWKLLALLPYFEEPTKALEALNVSQPNQSDLTMKRLQSVPPLPSQQHGMPTLMAELNDYTKIADNFKKLHTTAERKHFHRKKEFSLPALAMLKVARAFIEKLPAYATQVVHRLIDNREFFSGQDREFMTAMRKYMIGKGAIIDAITFGATRSLQNDTFEHSTGRYLARWPDDMKKTEQGKWDSPKENGDQHVVNFAKVMRLSNNNVHAHFWKEIAISASNLFVRIIGDVKALFAIHFADDPWWDGSCDSLPITVDPRGMNYADAQGDVAKHFYMFGDPEHPAFAADKPYPWASGSRVPSRRGAFAGDTLTMMAAHDSLWHIPNLKLRRMPTSSMEHMPPKPIVFPHLWCRTAEQAAKGKPRRQGYSNERDLEELVDAEATTKVQVIQACHIVIRDPRKGERAISRRPECEEMDLPISFVRMFPRFVHLVKQYLLKLEVLLLHINKCLDEALYEPMLVAARNIVMQDEDEREKRKQACENPENADDRMAYVRKKAKDVVRLVRMFLLRMGAQVHLGEVRRNETNNSMNLSQVETEVSQQKTNLNGPIAAIMADDFMLAFGVGIRRSRAGAFAMSCSPQTPQGVDLTDVSLEGVFWEDAWRLRENLKALAVGSLAHRPNQWEDDLAPMVEYEYGWRLTATTSDAALCTPPSATLNFEVIWKTKRKTWTNDAEISRCFWGLVKPGSTAIEYLHCKNTETQDVSSAITLKVNLFVLSLQTVGRDIVDKSFDAFLGSAGGGLGSLGMSSLNFAAMGLLGNNLQAQARADCTRNPSCKYLNALKWIGAMSAQGLPEMFSKGDMMDYFKKIGLANEIPAEDSGAKSGWQPFSAANIGILSYSQIVHTPADGVEKKVTSFSTFVWVNQISMKFSVPGAVDVTPVAAVVLVWLKPGQPDPVERLPDFINGDIDTL